MFVDLEIFEIFFFYFIIELIILPVHFKNILL